MINKHTILIIEDDSSTQILLQEILRQNGESAIICNDAEAGLELVSQVEPELVILDIQLPNIDGWEFFETLRRRHLKTCILLITGSKTQKTESFLKSHDEFSELLYKPYSNEEISTQIMTLLNKSYKISNKSFEWL